MHEREREGAGRTLADGLSGVGVEEDALVLLDDGANLLDGLDRANLVVDHHDRHEARVGANRLLEELEVDDAVLADGEVRHVEALVLEDAARVEDALVLGLGRDAARAGTSQ